MFEADGRPAVTTDGDALGRLGLVATAYLGLLAAIATLAPFELAWPKRFALDFGLRADDLVLNLLMLLPLGFASCLGARSPGRSVRRGLLLGLGLSVALELVQLFLPVRRCNPFDVMTNAAGAWLGAWLYACLRPWVDTRVLAVLRARPPLAALPFALLPAFWLDDLALYTPARGMLVVLLGVAGATAAGATWAERSHGLGLRTRVALWYLLGALPALLVSPASRLSTIALGLLCSVLAARGLRSHAHAGLHGPRAQQAALARCLPWLVAYLVAVALWTPALLHAPRWTLGFIPFDQMALLMMLAFLEYLGAFTLFGYLYALLAKQGALVSSRRIVVAGQAFGLALGLELVRAELFGGCASGTAIALLVIAAVSGACLHDAQRDVVLASVPAPRPLLARPAAA